MPISIIKRTEDICKKRGIDTSTITEIKDIFATVKGVDTVYGTSIRYKKDDYIVICVTLLSGWYKQYSYRGSQADSVRIVRDLRRNSFTQKQCASIMGVSASQIANLERSKNISDKED